MRKSRRLGFESALLVNYYIIAASLAASLLAWWKGLDTVAALLLAAGVLGLVSRLWSDFAFRSLRVTADCPDRTLSVGQSVTLRYTLENEKALPLLWLELCQPVPERECLAPESGFVLREFSPEETAYTGLPRVYMRRFSLLMGWSRQQWDCVWTGTRRGVYRPQELLLRTGDGFGLTQNTLRTEAFSGSVFVVWPRIVPVDSALLLRNVWTGRTGRAGWAEDPGVLRGERLYQPADPWKRIDWRTAARTDELYVRQYETILPQSFLFVLDTAKLTDPEDAISLLASALLALTGRGVACGLALPSTASAPALLLRPDDPAVTAETLLYALADFDADTAVPDSFDRTALLSAASEAGQLYLVGHSRVSLNAGQTAQALARSAPRFLCQEPDGDISFDRLRGREAAV